MSDLDRLRAEKDAFFATDRHSPITAEQKQQFVGLNYFPENPDLRFEVQVEPYAEKETLQMQITTGGVKTFIRFGKVKFLVEGQEAELTIFADENGFFLPFADALAGKETYGAGRYLEPELIGENTFLVDFNLAYNPYCAYNDAWACPITPFENRLKVPIRAGEKVFHLEDETT